VEGTEGTISRAEGSMQNRQEKVKILDKQDAIPKLMDVQELQG
jgi:hypothetical protein